MFSNIPDNYTKTTQNSKQTISKDDDTTNSIQIGGNYYSMYTNDDSLNKTHTVMDPSEFDKLLNGEKNTDHKENWNKLDSSIKIKKLEEYADDYGKTNSLLLDDIGILKNFFKSAIRNNKLKKNKEVIYDINTGIVMDVPGLFYSKLHKKYTIKNLDTKHVSTMKTYTPKRSSKKNKTKITE